jgi:uncharacterized membrane protein
MNDELIQPDESDDKSEDLEGAHFVDSLIKHYPNLFNDIDDDKKDELKKAISFSFSQIKSHSGPLPDIDTLDGYAKLIPNGAERIMVMAEKEQEFRHEMTKTVATTQLNQVGKGQLFGFVLGLLGIGGGIYLSSIGKETSGLTSIIVSIGALIGAFISGKRSNNSKND